MDRLKRMFGWKPISERRYHSSFPECRHYWNWERFGQCPECACGVLAAIQGGVMSEQTLSSLEYAIKAAGQKVDLDKLNEQVLPFLEDPIKVARPRMDCDIVDLQTLLSLEDAIKTARQREEQKEVDDEISKAGGKG